MSGVRSLLCRSICAPVNPCSRSGRFYGSCTNVSKFCFQYLPTVSGFSPSNKCKTVDWPSRHIGQTRDKSIALSFLLNNQQCRSDTSRQFSTKCSHDFRLGNTILHSHCAPVPLFSSASSHIRAYSSHVGGEQNGPKNATAVSSTAATESTEKTTDASEWMEALNQACKSVVNAGKRVKEVSDEVAVPYIHQLYESHPYLENVIVPVCGTLSAAILAWVVMPKILKKFHKYAMQSPLTLLARRSSPNDQVPYEKSFWSALEDPARYLVTFMAFSQLGVVIAPSASQYLSQLWRGAVVLSFIWFLQRWKTTFFARALTNEVLVGLERDRLLALEKVSSVGLLVLGVMALAEACGVPVQSILTVGGIGGVATAFAARDILGNLLSGLSLQFSKPFSLGDNIKAGSIEGQVVEMGLTTTSLINPEKFPVIVPNSLFLSQVIVNKSRAQWRASTIKIPLRIDDLEKIPLVSKEIKSMLCSHPKVLQDIDAPYCHLSRLENSFGELTVGCYLKNMKKGELFATEQDILLQAARIIRQHGGELGGTIHQSIGN